MNELPNPRSKTGDVMTDPVISDASDTNIPFTLKQTPPATRRRCYSSADLMGPEQEILIEHCGEFYRLRCTKLGKLVLQK